MIANFLSSLKNSALAGMLEYYAFPGKQNSWGGGGPFNGQHFRRRIFHELLAKCAFSRILETGSFRGVTTEFMQISSQLPVSSVEFSPRFHAFAKARIGRNPNIQFHKGDSRRFLTNHFKDSQSRIDRTFIYLDAHWQNDLPLKEEIAIIHNSHVPAVVMIDDFEVADDAGYAYDDYGKGKALTITYLRHTAFASKPWFYPSLPGHDETGAKRGVIIIPTSDPLADALRKSTTLREWLPKLD